MKRAIYRKRAQLSGAALLEDGDDLGHLARDAEDAGAGLQVAQGVHVDEGGGGGGAGAEAEAEAEEGGDAGGEGGDEQAGGGGAAAVVEDEDGDDDVLAEDEGGLAVGAEGEAVADVVRERDEVGRGLEQVGEEADAVGRPRPRQLDDLRHLHHRRRPDDADPQPLRHRQPQAPGVGRVQVQHQRLVARLADDGHAEVADRRRQALRDWLQGLQRGPESFHVLLLLLFLFLFLFCLSRLNFRSWLGETCRRDEVV